jgi:flagellar hook assembly protein FlgD
MRTTAMVAYQVPETHPVQLRVYDVQGRLVATLVDGPQEAGTHEIAWNGIGDRGEPLASGVYFLLLSNGSVRHNAKVVLSR